MFAQRFSRGLFALIVSFFVIPISSVNFAACDTNMASQTDPDTFVTGRTFLQDEPVRAYVTIVREDQYKNILGTTLADSDGSFRVGFNSGNHNDPSATISILVEYGDAETPCVAEVNNISVFGDGGVHDVGNVFLTPVATVPFGYQPEAPDIGTDTDNMSQEQEGEYITEKYAYSDGASCWCAEKNWLYHLVCCDTPGNWNHTYLCTWSVFACWFRFQEL